MIEGPTVMYSARPMDNVVGNVVDGSGTIDPAALNQAGVLVTPTSISNTSPRGLKRSRSPDQYGNAGAAGYEDDDDDSRPKKRGRPPKPERGSDGLTLQNPGSTQPVQQLPTPVSAQPSSAPQASQQQYQTPQQQPAQPPTPKQGSPTKPAAGKAVVKSLPTVRDHTTDQLNPEGDEYLPREIDEAGENKVSPQGRLLGSREYKTRTFLVPNRGDKLFMLATECARVLGYRDSYLLFNKNRSLYKIIATQAEKDDLIHQDILPYSYRSRQIAIVTAKSMFRQFGSRLVNLGRRVRDDYWEAKARKQGFTEDDMAGEKRPGSLKREAQATEAAQAGHAPGNVNYIDVPGGPPLNHPHMLSQYGPSHFPLGVAENRLPMIDTGYGGRDYSDVQRPRQDITGPAYQDRTVPSSMTELMNHAGHASDFNKSLTSQRSQRAGILHDYWEKKQPVSSPVQDSAPAPAQSIASPHLGMNNQPQPQMLPPQGSQQPAYQQQPGSGGGSPQAMRAQPPTMQPQRSSAMPSNYSQGVPPPSPSNQQYPPGSWQGYPQQSPIPNQQHVPNYGPPHPSPGHPGQPPSPHPSQSPSHLSGGPGAPPGQSQMPPPAGMQYPSHMQPMQQQGYAMNRPMYPGANPQQYMANNTSAGAPGGMPTYQPNWQPQY